ncbi:MAG: Holliday junction branch migration protein RuvA [Bdellovibrionales bacterium]|nr:Holliday junction branch migration protein RuvA [Bdellovibrionales bacterium]
MIGYLQGTPIGTDGDQLLLLVQGVGYELHCSKGTLAELEGLELAKLWVHTHVREDALMLFGFHHLSEKQLFLSLLKVNGIGPKSAMQILSASNFEKIIELIDLGDAKALSQLPKVGKKTAEQIILTLQGKLVRTETPKTSAGQLARAQVVSALVNLGFRLQDVEKVVEQLDPKLDVQEGIRASLAALTN